ncbi:MAG: phosphoribosylaminoimidazolesuccinocarboxamide synthase [Thermoproteota archaeon]|nr:phosphoribosylaminoimidazolesuccinocarboxamide synthase [Thermoproteota archaeon]
MVRSGKVKDIYELDNGNILFHFSDRISAFDIKMATPVPRKGEVLCKFAEFWFNSLQTPHHMLKVADKDKMEVKKLQMIPLECVVRGYFYGGLVERYKEYLGKQLPLDFRPDLGVKLPEPIFDPSTKSDEHDRPISRDSVLSLGILSDKDYHFLEITSISLYKKMTTIADKAGFILADVKFEFGLDDQGNITLGDSLGPDEYRLWLKSAYQPGKIQQSYDKQLLRDWLIKIGFKDMIERLAKEGKNPEPPKISWSVVNDLSTRYISAYEKISGCKL